MGADLSMTRTPRAPISVSRNPMRLVQTEHTMPTPALAGWTEQTRLVEAVRFRESVRINGGTIRSERRIRNVAFDERGDRTTFKFVVDWAPDGR